MKTRFPKVRSRIEKAFIGWYREYEKQWQLPLLLLCRKDGQMSFTMQGLSPNICIHLHAWEFGVYAEWQGECWDLLISYSAFSEPTENGYFDIFTMPDYREIYPTRERLWYAELFEPMMNWINNQLLPAKWVGLYKCKGGWWAEMIEAPDPAAKTSFPIWLDQNSAQAV